MSNRNNLDIVLAELRLDGDGTQIDTQCYLSKLMLALTIPSFCSKYIHENHSDKAYPKKERERYPKWCDEYLDFPKLKATECYAARCSLSHHGDDDLETQSVLDGTTERYTLSIPYMGNDVNLVNMAQSDDPRSFCSNGLINCMVIAYEKFREEYPDFVYPLQQR